MRKPELPGLTGIRFYAAFLVFISHLVEVMPGMASLGGTLLIFNVGVVGVSFFFVLSGFILAYNYADLFSSGVAARSYRTFVWTRLTKIYPVYLLALTLGMSMAILSPNWNSNWLAIPLHLFLFQNWLPFTEPALFGYFNGPAWALSCEWFFYLLAPIAFFAVLHKKYRWIPLGATVGYMALLCMVLLNGQPDAVRLYWVSWFAPSRFLEFVAGAYVAIVFLASPEGNLEKYSRLMQLAGLLMITAGAIYRPSAPWPLWAGWLYLPGSLLLILGLAYGRGFLVAHLSGPWLKHLGLASFSLYVLHVPLLRVARILCNYVGWEVQSWIIFTLVGIMLFVCIQACASLVHTRFEVPVQWALRIRSQATLTSTEFTSAIKGAGEPASPSPQIDHSRERIEEGMSALR